MTEIIPTNYDVAIIGLGPVGASLANLLGQLGLSTVALERASEISQMPRAVAFDDEVMRIFQTMGLSDEVQNIVEPETGAKFVNSTGQTLVHWERPMECTPNGWFLNYQFNQPELEKTLRQGAARYPSVSIKPSCDVTKLRNLEDEVEVTFSENGKKNVLRATYVVGCDGGRSFVREQIGSEFEDLGFHEEWLIVDLLLSEHELNPDRSTYHYCGFSRMGSKVFVGSKRKRWEFRLNDTDDRAVIHKPDVVWDILAPWITPGEATLERTALYTFQSTITDKWQNNRIFLAGDAARQAPPFMAQVMCAGIRDISNLAWKLGRVLRQKTTDQILATYQSERSPHVREYINMTIEFGKLINNTAKSVIGGNPKDAGNGQQTIKQLRPKLGQGTSAGNSQRRGRLLPQFILCDGMSLDQYVGFRAVLILRVEGETQIDEVIRSEFVAADIAIMDTPGSDLTD